MTKEISLDDALDGFKHFCAENPYTGTTQQIVTLSLGLHEAGKRLQPSAFRLYKEATDINPKIVSKLNVIGKTLGKMNEKERRDVVEKLPASYSTIHLLCSLPPNELVTAARSGSLTPSISIREAKDYVTQVRFPQIAATDGDKGRWSIKQEHLALSVVQRADGQVDKVLTSGVDIKNDVAEAKRCFAAADFSCAGDALDGAPLLSLAREQKKERARHRHDAQA